MSEIKLVLGSHNYTVEEPIKVSLLAEYADTLAPTTEQNRSTRLGLSQFAIDFSGGFGCAKIDFSRPETLTRFYDSECETRWPGLVTPPALVNTTTLDTHGVFDEHRIERFAEFENGLYGLTECHSSATPTLYGLHVHYGTGTSLSNEATVHYAADANDRYYVGDIAAHGIYVFALFTLYDDSVPGYTHFLYRSADGSTWADAVATGKPTAAVSDRAGLLLSMGTTLYMTFWDKSAGEILVYSSTDNGANVSSIGSVSSAGKATGLCSFNDVDGNDVPWLGTPEGGYIIQASSIDGPWISMKQDTDSRNCIEMLEWAGSLYVPRGEGCSRCAFSGTSNALMVQAMGLNRGDGLITAKQGKTTAMFPSDYWLFAAYGGLAASKYAGVYAWDGTGWHFIMKHGTANQDILAMSIFKGNLFVSVDTAATTCTVYRLDDVLINPKQNSSMKFETGKTIVAPQFGGAEPEVNGAVFRMDMDADDLTASDETIGVKYGLNGAAYTTALGTFTSADYDLDFGTGNVGAECKGMQPEFTLNRAAGTNTNRPIMYKPVLHYRKKRNRRQQFEFAIDTSRQEGLNEEILSETVMSWLETDIDTQTLLALKYGATDTDTYAVDTLVEFDDFVEVSSLLNLDNIPEGKRAGLVGVRVREVIK